MGNYLRKLPLWGDDKLRMKGGINFEYPTAKEFEQMPSTTKLDKIIFERSAFGEEILGCSLTLIDGKDSAKPVV